MAQYRVKRGDSLSKIASNHDLSLNQLLALNPRYKADPNRLAVGDQLQVAATSPTPPSPATRIETPAETTAQTDWFSVPMGQLTFDAEGMEKPRSVYHSRRPHVPGPWSGVTIGRGFDMRERSREAIFDDLRAAGMPVGDARKLSRCAGYAGDRARQYLKDNDLKTLNITPAAQNRLFLSTYEELAGDVIRICEKHDVVAKYGPTDWQQLDPTVRDIAIDLRYRGDYTPATRRKVQVLW